MDTAAPAPRRNRAFISYSQADIAEARRLQKWLETYRLPASAANAQTGRRIGRIFRDETDLSGAADLGAALKSEIDGSDALIVLCSPRSARSQWVEREILHFRQTGRSDRIFAVILDGEPNSADPERECFPPSFRPVAGGDMPIEPLAVNLATDGRDRACTRLAAGLMNLKFDDLWRRERRRQRARMALAGAMLGLGLALTAAAAVGGWLAVTGMMEVERQSSGLIAQQAGLVHDGGDGDMATALLLALEADPLAARSPLRRMFEPGAENPDARLWLEKAYLANRLVRILPGPGGPASGGSVLQVAASSDGARIAAWAPGEPVTVVETASGRQLAALNRPADPSVVFEAIAFSPDGSRLAIVNGLNLSVWDIASGDQTAALRFDQTLTSIAFAPDGRRIVAGSNGLAPVSRIVDLATGAEIRLENDPALAVAFSPDGARVATAGRRLTVWDAATGAALASFDTPAPDPDSLAFSADSDLISIASRGGAAATFDLASGASLARIGAGDDPSARTVLSADGTRLATVAGSAAVAVRDMATGERLATLSGHRGKVFALAFLPGGDGLVSGSADGDVRVWSLSGPQPPARLALPEAANGLAIQVAFGPDGRQVSAAVEGAGRIWSLDTGKATDVPGVDFLALTPQGPRGLAVEAGGVDLREIGGNGGRRRAAGGGEAPGVYLSNAAAFSRDGSRVALGGRSGRVRVVDAATGAMVATLRAGSGALAPVALSPDGTRIATGAADGSASVWDIASSTRIARIKAHGRDITALAFSPDGTMLATASLDRTAAVWDIASGSRRALMGGAGEAVRALAFSPDGRRLATGSADGWVRLHDAARGELTLRMAASGPVYSLAYAPGGNRLAAGSSTGAAEVWTLPDMLHVAPEVQVQLACAALADAGAPQALDAEAARRFPALADTDEDGDRAADRLPPCAATPAPKQ